MFLTVSVNELTRRLKFLNSSAVVVVSGDNEINGIIFQLPASYEGGFDFSTATWRVNYTDTAGDDHTVLITETDESTGYPFWQFDDVINKGANGTVKFAFVVSNVDADTAAVAEKWNSLPGTFSVLKTVTGSNSDEEAEENTTYDRLASAVQAIREAQASVDNVGEVLASLTGSSPQVVDTVADLANIDTTQYLIAIVMADGYLYYYDGSDWQQGFVYGSYELDTELPEDGGASGKAADSGLVGEEIGELKGDLGALSNLDTTDKSSLVAAVNEVISTKQGTLTFDTTPTANSSNPVTSGGVAAALGNVTVPVDATLTQTGQAADAKATGDAIAALNEDINANLSALNPRTFVRKKEDDIVIPEETVGFYGKNGDEWRYHRATAWHNITTSAIMCSPGDVFEVTLKTTAGNNVAYFSEDGVCVSTESVSSNTETAITIPEGVGYVAFQAYHPTSYTISASIKRGALPVKWSIVSGTDEGIDEGLIWTKGALKGEWRKGASYKELNLVKYLLGVDNDYISFENLTSVYRVDENGKLKKGFNGIFSRNTGRLQCEEGWVFSYSGKGDSIMPCAFFFADENTDDVLASIPYATTITVPAGAKYAMFQSNNRNESALQLSVSLIYPTITIPMPLKGLKWAAIGDSITEKNGHATTNWVDMFTSIDRANIINLGKGWTGFKAGDDNYITRISSIPQDVELITVSGSFNDIWNNYTLGTIDDMDDSTIAGCMNLFFTALLEAFPAVPIGIYTTGPWYVYHSGIEKSDSYVLMLEAMAKKYGIPFYSIYDKTNLRPWVDGNKSVYYGDVGIHPNMEGHKLMYAAYKPFIESLVYPKG